MKYVLDVSTKQRLKLNLDIIFEVWYKKFKFMKNGACCCKVDRKQYASTFPPVTNKKKKFIYQFSFIRNVRNKSLQTKCAALGPLPDNNSHGRQWEPNIVYLN